MGEIKTEFEIQGNILKLETIKLIQIEMLADLLGEVDLDSNLKTIGQIIKEIRKKGLNGFFDIVFYDQDIEGIDWKMISYEMADEIIESFFLLNPRLKKRLLEFLNNFLPKLLSTLNLYNKNTTSK